jgi:hypothetical protein
MNKIVEKNINIDFAYSKTDNFFVKCSIKKIKCILNPNKVGK